MGNPDHGWLRPTDGLIRPRIQNPRSSRNIHLRLISSSRVPNQRPKNTSHAPPFAHPARPETCGPEGAQEGSRGLERSSTPGQPPPNTRRTPVGVPEDWDNAPIGMIDQAIPSAGNPGFLKTNTQRTTSILCRRSRPDTFRPDFCHLARLCATRQLLMARTVWRLMLSEWFFSRGLSHAP